MKSTYDPLHKVRPAVARTRTQRIVAVSRMCRERPGAINLCFGESDLGTPQSVRYAAERALAEGETMYSDRRGIPALRDAIQEYHQFTHGLDINRERITATSSGMTSIMIALQSLIEPGDNVVIVAPVWPNVVIAVEAMGAEARFVPLRRDGLEWTLSVGDVEERCDHRTRAIFVASPSNPTGWTIDTPQMVELLDIARRLRTWIISDEVYNRIVFDGGVASPSFLQVADDDDLLFVVQSFSKTWCMTGWRLGWLVHPSTIGNQIGNLSAINSTGSATFVQHAGIAAIREGEPFVEALRDRCITGRSIVQDHLAECARVDLPVTPASFYSFFRIDGVDDDLGYAEQLVQDAGVGLAPGSAFGPAFDGYFRICFAQDQRVLTEALNRLVDHLRVDL